MKEIASNIRALRKRKGMSQEEFAQALHVTRQTVSAWERGISQPGLETLAQIAQVLDVEVECLLYGEKTEREVRYRSVTLWPVLAVFPAFFVMVFWVLPAVMGWMWGKVTDTVLLLCGQMFLSALIMLVYCALKDEIRNRDYYEKYPDGTGEEEPANKDRE